VRVARDEPAVRLGRPQHKETAHLGLRREGGRDRLGLHLTPSELLLEPAELRMHLRHNGLASGGIVQHEVGVAARRGRDPNLQPRAPRAVGQGQERLAHRHLEMIAKGRTRARVAAHGEVTAERRREAGQDLLGVRSTASIALRYGRRIPAACATPLWLRPTSSRRPIST